MIHVTCDRCGADLGVRSLTDQKYTTITFTRNGKTLRDAVQLCDECEWRVEDVIDRVEVAKPVTAVQEPPKPPIDKKPPARPFRELTAQEKAVWFYIEDYGPVTANNVADSFKFGTDDPKLARSRAYPILRVLEAQGKIRRAGFKVGDRPTDKSVLWEAVE